MLAGKKKEKKVYRSVAGLYRGDEHDGEKLEGIVWTRWMLATGLIMRGDEVMK